MKRQLTKEEVLRKIQEQMDRLELPFYRIPVLNYTGQCADEDGTCSYSEVIARWLYDSFLTLDEMINFLLKNSHMRPERKFPSEPIHHKEAITFTSGTGRNEENIAKRLLQIGHFSSSRFQEMQLIDYQVPINRIQHSTEGKADLVFVLQNQIIIGELKDEDSHETLLRAVVEARSYQCRIESEITAFQRYVSSYLPNHSVDIKADNVGIVFQPAVFIFSGKASQPWRDLERILADEHSYLRKLIARWDVMIFEVVELNDTVNLQDREYGIVRVL